MNSLGWGRSKALRHRLAVAWIIVLSAAGPCELNAQEPSPTPTPPIFDPRPLGVIPPPTPTPRRKFALDREEKPIPRGWKIGGAVAAALAAVAVVYAAARAWRSANIFDRQYLFPISRDAAVRFGGEKSGGHMATVRFRPEEAPLAGSKTKDA